MTAGFALLPTSAKSIFKCPEKFGYYPDTSDCTQYFVCVFGEPLHETCTGGLYFSAELQTCDWPRNVLCANKAQTQNFHGSSVSVFDEVDDTVEEGTKEHHDEPIVREVVTSRPPPRDITASSFDYDLIGEKFKHKDGRRNLTTSTSPAPFTRTSSAPLTTVRINHPQHHQSRNSQRVSSPPQKASSPPKASSPQFTTSYSAYVRPLNHSLDELARNLGGFNVKYVDNTFPTFNYHQISSTTQRPPHFSNSNARNKKQLQQTSSPPSYHSPSPYEPPVSITEFPQSTDTVKPVNTGPHHNKIVIDTEIQPPSYEAEAIPPLVDSKGGIHFSDGPGGSYGLSQQVPGILSNENPDSKVSVIYLKPIISNKDHEKLSRFTHDRQIQQQNHNQNNYRAEKAQNKRMIVSSGGERNSHSYNSPQYQPNGNQQQQHQYIPVITPEKAWIQDTTRHPFNYDDEKVSTESPSENRPQTHPTHIDSHFEPPQNDGHERSRERRVEEEESTHDRFDSRFDSNREDHTPKEIRSRPEAVVSRNVNSYQNWLQLTTPLNNQYHHHQLHASPPQPKHPPPPPEILFNLPEETPINASSNAYYDVGEGNRLGVKPNPNAQVVMIPVKVPAGSRTGIGRVRVLPRVMAKAANPMNIFNENSPDFGVIFDDDTYDEIDERKQGDPPSTTPDPPSSTTKGSTGHREYHEAMMNKQRHELKSERSTPHKLTSTSSVTYSESTSTSIAPQKFEKEVVAVDDTFREYTPYQNVDHHHYSNPHPQNNLAQNQNSHNNNQHNAHHNQSHYHHQIKSTTMNSSKPAGVVYDELSIDRQREKEKVTDYTIPHHNSPAPNDKPVKPPKKNKITYVSTPRPTINSSVPPIQSSSTTQRTPTTTPVSSTTISSTTSISTTTPRPVVSPTVPSHRLSGLRQKSRPTNKRLVIKQRTTAPPKLPSRPKPLYPTPQPLGPAGKCDSKICRLPDCNCGGSSIPGGYRPENIPQMVMITFDDAINDLNYDIYDEIFNSGRKNPNGCPLLGTFYVSHEWTDYGQVQSLYSRGHEMASHGIT